MATYAAKTDVSSEKTRVEIERTLARYGADEFAYGSGRDRAMIGFTFQGRQYRFDLRLPDRDSREFTHTLTRGLKRSPDEVTRAYEQAVRQRWRALALVIKAKLAAVDDGISTFEEEFGMRTMLPGGRVVVDHLLPAIAVAYETGRVPQLLPWREDLAQIEGPR